MKMVKKAMRYVRMYFMPLFLLLFVLSMAYGAIHSSSTSDPHGASVSTVPQTISYNTFLQKIKNKQIESARINFNNPTFYVVDKKNRSYETDNPRTPNFKEFLLENNVQVVEEAPAPSPLTDILIALTLICAGYIIASYIARRNGKNIRVGNHSIRIKMGEVKEIPSITFKDIAGNEHVKRDVSFIIDFLKHKDKYQRVGARMPKGIIFYGAPGTGKTLCAKAIAGEAGVPFFSVSGSDFVEMYVGVGAKRVRELFEEARKKAPCIVFIDEIDAVGKKRTLDSNTEKDQTINALLTELDGFSTSEGIVVIGATNRIEILDDALVRPGRFDKHIAIPLPEYKERIDILKLHARNKKLDDSVNLETIAKLTIGFSGAGLETLLNESAIIAVGKNKESISNEDIDDAYYKAIMKGDKKSVKDVNEEQLKLVAWHESGHAMVAKLLTKKSIPKVTIIPSTNGAGGVTFIIPDKAGLHTRQDLINDVKINYAGRIAEYLLTGDENSITTGASQDIKQATNLLVGMVKEFGMTSEFGMLYLVDVGWATEKEIIEQAKVMSKKFYEETLELMKKNKHTLEAIANRLLEKETIEEDELDEIVLVS